MSSIDIAMAAAGAASGPTYIEDVFSTYLYTGNGGSQTINNGIDLAGKGGMVWTKIRDTAYSNALVDTNRGTSYVLCSDRIDSQYNYPDISSFNSNGYTIGQNYSSWFNASSKTYASWTFRKAPKFFDVVTYTGNDAPNRTISHSLGQVPGMIIVKSSSDALGWRVYHRSLTNSDYLELNSTAAVATSSTIWGSATPTSANFTVGSNAYTNAGGVTYVAYLFAHDTTTDGLIRCGSFSPQGNLVHETLGWEPQFLLVKRIDNTGDWILVDNMRGVTAATTIPALKNVALNPNNSNTEGTSYGTDSFSISSTGFSSAENGTIVYMAIRRGPMRTPTDGTKVFSPVSSSAAQGTKLTTGFPVDSQFTGVRAGDSDNMTVIDRLRYTSTNTTETSGYFLETSNTGAENTGPTGSRARYWDNTGFQMPGSYSNASTIFWNFQRAPGFFDVVCYTGTGVARTVNHNLGVAPELMIVKGRSNAYSWSVYSQPTGNTKYLWLEATDAATVNSSYWNNTSPTSSVFTVGATVRTNESSQTYVAYLFASCPGVSKVGSFTGTGSTQTISCGFTGGARFVLIKRTDSTGDWYVWDTARGMVAGTDPSLLLNSTAAEVNANSVYTTTGGFQIVSTAAGINASGGTYIYLAIA